MSVALPVLLAAILLHQHLEADEGSRFAQPTVTWRCLFFGGDFCTWGSQPLSGSAALGWEEGRCRLAQSHPRVPAPGVGHVSSTTVPRQLPVSKPATLVCKSSAWGWRRHRFSCDSTEPVLKKPLLALYRGHWLQALQLMSPCGRGSSAWGAGCPQGSSHLLREFQGHLSK